MTVGGIDADTDDCMAKSRRSEAMQKVERRRTPKPSLQGSIHSASCVQERFPSQNELKQLHRL